MTTPNHEQFMEMALEEARKGQAEGNGPYGCVIVRDGQVVARAHNETTSTHDPTSHAETQAVRKAGLAQGDENLSGCTLYIHGVPCPMCLGAILVSQVSTLIMGAGIPPSRPWGDYSVERLLEMVQRSSRLNVVTGVLQEKSEAMRDEWLRQHG